MASLLLNDVIGNSTLLISCLIHWMAPPTGGAFRVMGGLSWNITANRAQTVTCHFVLLYIPVHKPPPFFEFLEVKSLGRVLLCCAEKRNNFIVQFAGLKGTILFLKGWQNFAVKEIQRFEGWVSFISTNIHVGLLMEGTNFSTLVSRANFLHVSGVESEHNLVGLCQRNAHSSALSDWLKPESQLCNIFNQ